MRPLPLDIATGVALGAARRPPPLPDAPGESVAAALERAVLPALRRSPCLVSFSGGRDSAAVLAVAAGAAARHGLPAPIPVTNRFPAVREAEETAWQERVVAHLGLADWLRLEFTDELDVVGPYAQRVLRDVGLVWPFNAHFHLPMLDVAAGGALLTGIGGDELFAAACRPELPGGPRRLAHALLAHSPRPLRRSVLARRRPFTLPWLSPAGDRLARGAAARHDAAEPWSAPARLRWARGMRCLALGPEGLAGVAALTGTEIHHPLLDAGVWGAAARAAGRRGFADRSQGMVRTLGALLPADVLTREGKASFDGAFFTDRARAAAATWSGGGVPELLVDSERLAAEWRAEHPMAHSYSLLQSAWLSEPASKAARTPGCRPSAAPGGTRDARNSAAIAALACGARHPRLDGPGRATGF